MKLIKTFLLTISMMIVSSGAFASESDMGHYKVKKGDYLGKISTELYGTFRLSDELYSWNRDKMKSKDLIRAGVVLVYEKEPAKLIALRAKWGKKNAHASHASEDSTREIASIAPAHPVPSTEIVKIKEDLIDENNENSIVPSSATFAAVAIGKDHLRQGRFEDARIQFAEARSENPVDPAPRVMEIVALVRMDKKDEASSLAGELVELNKDYCALAIIKSLNTDQKCK